MRYTDTERKGSTVNSAATFKLCPNCMWQMARAKRISIIPGTLSHIVVR